MVDWSRLDRRVDIEHMRGKTFTYILGGEPGGDVIEFVTDSGDRYAMLHDQDCCEHVRIAEISGNMGSLCGSPILQAEVAESSSDEDDSSRPSEYSESWTWTFYKLATIRGYVTIRWLGESNGYYSERVDLYYKPAGEETV